MESIVLIHNFCTHIVGYNQIKTVFDLEYELYIMLDGYDRVSSYYLLLVSNFVVLVDQLLRKEAGLLGDG